MQNLSVNNLISLGIIAILIAVIFFIPYENSLIPPFYSQWWCVLIASVAIPFIYINSNRHYMSVPLFVVVPFLLAIYFALHAFAGYNLYSSINSLFQSGLLICVMIIVFGASLKRSVGIEIISNLLAGTFIFFASLKAILGFVDSNIVRASITEATIVTAESKYASLLFACGLMSLMHFMFKKYIALPYAILIGTLLCMGLAFASQAIHSIFIIIIVCFGYLTYHHRYRSLLIFWPVMLYFIWSILAHWIEQKTLHQDIYQVFYGISNYWKLLPSAWDIFLKHPLLGVGWGQFAWHEFNAAESLHQFSISIDHPHNLFIQLLCEMGLIGFLIVALGLWLFILRVSSSRLNHHHHFLIGLFAVVLAFILFEGQISDIRALVLFSLLVGLLEVNHIKIDFALGRIVLLLAFAFTVVILEKTKREFDQIQYWYAQNEFIRINDVQSRSMLPAMLRLRPKSLLTPYIDIAIARALPDEPKVMDQKLALNAKIIRFNPNAFDIYNRIELLTLAKQYEQASYLAKLAQNKFPDYVP